jgi:hypothetical protein
VGRTWHGGLLFQSEGYGQVTAMCFTHRDRHRWSDPGVASQRSSFQLLCKLRSLGTGAEDRRAKQSCRIKSSSRGLMGFVR